MRLYLRICVTVTHNACVTPPTPFSVLPMHVWVHLCVCVSICTHIWICRMYIVAWEIECASLLNRTHVFERRFSYKQRQVSSTAKCAGNLSLMHYFHFKQVVGPALFLESTVMDLPGRRRSTCNSRSFIYITQGEGLLPWRTTYTHIA